MGLNRDRITGVLWSRPGEATAPVLGAGLRALSIGYGVAVRLRAFLYHRGWLAVRSLPRPVVSVGNITVGGTGKTPLILYLADRLRRARYRPAVVSRGYGGTAQAGGAVVSDGDGERASLDVAKAGDEPFLMARRLKTVPVVVGRDRHRAGTIAVDRFSPDLILLDDGFQHLRLRRNLDIVLADARRPLGNGYLLPRGPLREPATALSRAHGAVLTRCDRADDGGAGAEATLRRFLPAGAPVFRSVHHPVIRSLHRGTAGAFPTSPNSFEIQILMASPDRGTLVFSGIADNAEVERSAVALGATVVGRVGFPDHHAYTADDISKVVEAARKAGAEILLTTEKDAVRLPTADPIPLDLIVIGVEIDFGAHAAPFFDWVESGLK